MEGFIIIMFNLSHPNKVLAPFLLQDEADNTEIFETEKEATNWIAENKRAPFAYAVVDVSELDLYTY
jgi:hypothetical protein